MKELSKGNLIAMDEKTVTGKTVGENIEKAKLLDEEVIRPITTPYSETGGDKGTSGEFAPDGAVVKQ